MNPGESVFFSEKDSSEWARTIWDYLCYAKIEYLVKNKPERIMSISENHF